MTVRAVLVRFVASLALLFIANAARAADCYDVTIHRPGSIG